MKKVTLMKILIGFVILFADGVRAQEQVPTYLPDRPGMAYNAYSIGVGQVSYEASIGMIPDFITFTNMFRCNVHKHFEFKFGMDIISNGETLGIPTAIRDVNLGIKMPLWADVKGLPDVALVGTVVLPKSGTTNFAPTQYVPSVTLIAQKAFGNWILIGNGGMFCDAITQNGCSYMNQYSKNRKLQGSYAFAVNYIIGNTGIFCETYGFYGNGIKPYAATDFGFNYLIVPNFIVDASFGLGYQRGLNDSFINCGFGWRIPNN